MAHCKTCCIKPTYHFVDQDWQENQNCHVESLIQRVKPTAQCGAYRGYNLQECILSCSKKNETSNKSESQVEKITLRIFDTKKMMKKLFAKNKRDELKHQETENEKVNWKLH